MIGEFVPGRHPVHGQVLLVAIQSNEAVVADTEGNLHLVGVEDVSIDWHYDSSDGQWKSDFDGAP